MRPQRCTFTAPPPCPHAQAPLLDRALEDFVPQPSRLHLEVGYLVKGDRVVVVGDREPHTTVAMLCDRLLHSLDELRAEAEAARILVDVQLEKVCWARTAEVDRGEADEARRVVDGENRNFADSTASSVLSTPSMCGKALIHSSMTETYASGSAHAPGSYRPSFGGAGDEASLAKREDATIAAVVAVEGRVTAAVEVEATEAEA